MSMCVKLEDLEKNKDNLDYFKDRMISIEDVFKDKPKVMLDKKRVELFLNGVNLRLDEVKFEEFSEADVFLKNDFVCRVYGNNIGFVGTCIVKNGFLKRDVV